MTYETETSTMPDLSSFTFTAESAGVPPDAPRWARGNASRAYWVTLSRDAERMGLFFYCGPLAAPPTLGDVLGSLCSDATYADDPGELDAVTEGLPYSEARKVADAIERQTAELRDLLGDDFDAFVFPGDADPPADFR